MTRKFSHWDKMASNIQSKRDSFDQTKRDWLNKSMTKLTKASSLVKT